MSGICGILRLDGDPPDGIEAMAARLEQRGPEGTSLFREGSCALGHTLLATTPEALVERMPFTHAETGCTITADLRLDNREVLMPALSLSRLNRTVGDGEIVLMAYLQWGEDCTKHLMGDFAFAIWDPRHRRLFCARDQMGMKQLIHAHVAGRVFALASAPSAVILAAGVPRAINEGRIADYLENLEWIDFTSTFFEGVERLPPAHSLTVDPSGCLIRRYWTLEPGEPFHRITMDEAAEGLRAVLDAAVASRLRCAGPVGSMLSGGMDSSSVTALAARRSLAAGLPPLRSYSLVGPDPSACVETRAIHDALAIPHLDPRLCDWSKVGPWQDRLIDLMFDLEEPFDASLNILRWLYLSAVEDDIKVVLDGGTGDVVLTQGDYLANLIRRFRWATALREISGNGAFYGTENTFRAIGLPALKAALVPNALRHLGRHLANFRAADDPGELIHPEFAGRIHLGRRKVGNRNLDPPLTGPAAQRRARSIMSNNITVGREHYDRAAAALGVEPRDPFIDLRVLDFVLRCPQTMMMRDGWPKVILRDAMAGIVPDSVRWRRGKEHIGNDLTRALLETEAVKARLRDASLIRLDLYLAPNVSARTRQAGLDPLSSAADFDVLALCVWLIDD